MPGIPPPPPAPYALLTSTNCDGQVHLVIGCNPLAAARAQKSREAGARVKLVAPEGEELPYGLQRRIDESEVEWVRRPFAADDLETLGREEVGGVVDLVWITSGAREEETRISARCRRLRIPVNIVDRPELCTFTLLATHSSGPLQIGVTTSGNGCKLASRIRREIAASLPQNLGPACERIGALRRRLLDEAGAILPSDDDDTGDQTSTFNTLITPSIADEKTRRLRWLSQVCEYWPLDRLCAFDPSEVFDISPLSASTPPPAQKTGKILLVGAGPGHPDLLTTASLRVLQSADLVLADKLVPSAVLALIPRRTPLFIAKKFPGNADAAQEELLSRGLAALQNGDTVVRLKQGDPYIYGRGGEEFLFFEKRGFQPVVLPGITSALSAPLFADIPATQRGVSDQVLICTGTGRKGQPPEPPEWVETRTTVFLMALHRVNALVEELANKGWPRDVPVAVVERASCRDQRVVRTTLGMVGRAVEDVGSRPPGLLVVGRACAVLKRGDKGWVVEEGFDGF